MHPLYFRGLKIRHVRGKHDRGDGYELGLGDSAVHYVSSDSGGVVRGCDHPLVAYQSHSRSGYYPSHGARRAYGGLLLCVAPASGR